MLLYISKYRYTRFFSPNISITSKSGGPVGSTGSTLRAQKPPLLHSFIHHGQQINRAKSLKSASVLLNSLNLN